MTLDWLLERFAGAPDGLAFVHEGRSVRYGELLRQVAAFEQRLAREGVHAGQRVVVLGDYTPEAFALLLALARNGNVVIPLTRESVVELSAALSVSGCEWIFEFAAGAVEPTLTWSPVEVDNTTMREFIAGGAPGLVFFSSGSTGRPKGILHDLGRVAGKFVKPRSPVVAVPFLMFDHFGGFNTILAITSSLGTVVSVAERSVASVCAAIETYRVTLLPTTPSFLNLLLAARAHEAYDLSSLQRISYGTEVMPQATLDRLARALPNVVLQQTYGLSEVGVLASKSRGDGSLWMRIGGEGFETKVVDGILWIRSEYSMVGYLNAASNFDADGWFNTQDKVEVDGDYFRILGRVTDLINVGGQKVYPTEIEEVIMTLPNIVDVAVFAEANPLLGQMIVARVVLAQPEPVDGVKSRIRQACRAALAAYKVPAKVVIATEPIHTARHKKSRRADPAR
ncbi:MULTISPECIES: fatty acid--CoA ligase family protein [Rubrivivax]|uniref:Long-chain fatty acid--CoA ligase n=1 Tax=Rubrivivax benzoatilyticus TaxID=316997 RepID=A0ABX0HY36_9BURK|nr:MULTISPECIES: fatty acid--CoA ligase family protein [Rubrivivax]EGJ11388.1 AMP-dependent synthetase and ligase [Rubrivivax benzoatilyticus JA2 = ATCC BAA-35]MCC9596193.1 long-chain fatty acid--CoA ligase [Rubrivivax sp. JA1055]MCC9647466.1 long-chain fatty acid--CoA ligase [Rubrivivax sp. JA1029]NHK99906.1 long-chain fatty acid--CoA ligase [Rubrivivax benzoatilyticus]NHL25815.1 long-chain fatty acid--CoA ligase [Rubrivivax benzoatilyticus]